MLWGVQEGYMGMNRKQLIPWRWVEKEMICDPQELWKKHKTGEKEANQFFNKCPQSTGTRKCNNQSINQIITVFIKSQVL